MQGIAPPHADGEAAEDGKQDRCRVFLNGSDTKAKVVVFWEKRPCMLETFSRDDFDRLKAER